MKRRTPNTKPKKGSRGPADNFDPAWCVRVLDLGAEGMSRAEIAAELKVGRTSLYSYIEKYPDFSKAMEEADFLCRAWWEKQGRLGINKGQHSFNAHTFQFMLKNKWPKDYRDKQEIEHTGDAFKDFLASARKAGKAAPKNPHGGPDEE